MFLVRIHKQPLASTTVEIGLGLVLVPLLLLAMLGCMIYKVHFPTSPLQTNVYRTELRASAHTHAHMHAVDMHKRQAPLSQPLFQSPPPYNYDLSS